MTTTFEAMVIGNDRSGYTLNPKFGEHEGITVAEWKAQVEANGYTVTENLDLEGRIENQQGTVYHCATALDEAVYKTHARGHFVDLCVWEETNAR